MKVIQIHNWHRFGGGSESMVEKTAEILQQNGHQAVLCLRDSRELSRGIIGKMRSFFCGIYCYSARQQVRELILAEKPDLVHVHELYPFFSPWILLDCQRLQVPVVMTCHDYRLSCPIATHFRQGRSCSACKGGRAYWCLLKNCRNNRLESLGYALRSQFAHALGLYFRYVTRFITPSRFVAQWLSELGVPAEKMQIVSNFVPIPSQATEPARGTYVGFVGRFCPEKGIDVLMSAARKSQLPFRMAGDYRAMPEFVASAPQNVAFPGGLSSAQVADFYRQARISVVPSTVQESFGLVAAEAMSHGLPVIASKIGGLAEIVEDGVTGFLVNPGDSDQLAEKIHYLWSNPDRCTRMGQAGRQKVMREFSIDQYYLHLMSAYDHTLSHQN